MYEIVVFLRAKIITFRQLPIWLRPSKAYMNQIVKLQSIFQAVNLNIKSVIIRLFGDPYFSENTRNWKLRKRSFIQMEKTLNVDIRRYFPFKVKFYELSLYSICNYYIISQKSVWISPPVVVDNLVACGHWSLTISETDSNHACSVSHSFGAIIQSWNNSKFL